MAKKGLKKGSVRKSTWIRRTLPYLSLDCDNKNENTPKNYLSNPPPGSMLQMYFIFFNAESIHVFSYTFVDICSATSYPFGFISRSKWKLLYTLKPLVNTLKNQDNKFVSIQVDEEYAVTRSSELTRSCHNINIIVKKSVDIHLPSITKVK